MPDFICLRCETPTASEVWACPNCDPTLCACGNAKYSANASRCSDCAAKKAAELLGGDPADFQHPLDPEWPAKAAAAKAAWEALDRLSQRQV